MRVIVTGASHGIGQGIARVLARNGMAVGLLARSTEKLDALATEIRAHGGTAFCAPCDLRDAVSTAGAITKLTQDLGGVDALINNAGLVIRKNAFDLSMDDWHAMVETNINGVFYATRAVLPAMRAQGSGHLINVSSISGKFPLPGGSAYAATKYAVTGFSQSLFQEVRDFGIKVSIVYPGSVDSASHRHDAEADHSWKVSPEEVGEACLGILRTGPGNCIHELEIRPLARPPKA